MIGRSLKEEGISPGKLPGYRTMWTGLNMILQNIGAFAGMLSFTRLASRHGRKPVFAIGFGCALGLVGGLLPALRAARLPVATALRAT